MREVIRADAVAREPSPRVRRVLRWWGSGGVVGGLWVVARRTARWRERVFGFESRVALDREALSLITPIRSLSFVILPMDTRGERELSFVFL